MTRRLKRWVRRLISGLTLLFLGYVVILYSWIRSQANVDQARPAEFLVVLGAAQYNGRPSPVLKARLDHAATLFSKRMATHIVTTGGHGLDKNYTEAGVARDYLIKLGVPGSAIQAEVSGDTTLQSLRSVQKLLHAAEAHSCVVVSDGFHLFRVRSILADEGIEAYLSPAPGSPIENSAVARFGHSLREVFVYTAYELHIRK